MERKSYLTSKAFRLFLGASILTALSSMLGNIIDGIILSHLIDYNAMSATSLCKPIIQGNYTFYQLVGLGASILVAKAMGQNDRKRMSHLFTMTVAVLTLYSLAEMVAALLFPDPIVSAFCKNEALHDYAKDYFIPTMLGTPLFMGVYFLGGFNAIDGSPKLVSVAMVIDNVIHIVMDFALIQAFSMGVSGGAVATLIGHAIAIAIMSGHYFGGKSLYRFAVLKFKDFGKALGEACSTGMPFAVASICMTIYFFCTQNIVSTGLGKEGLFIFSVMLNIMTIYNMFITGACQTMQQLAAIQLGLGDNFGHRMTVKEAFRFLNISLGSAFLLLLVFPQIIALTFDCPQELMDECCYGVRIYGFAFWVFCLLYLLMVNYKLLRLSGIANFISFALSLTVIPVMWLNVNYMQELVWWSNLIAYLLVLVAVLIISAVIRRKNRDLSPIILIPRTSQNPTFDLSFGYSEESMHESFQKLSQWLNEQNLDKHIIYRIRVTAEELMSNIARHGEQKNKKAFADVRLMITDKAVKMALNDDGIPFDPVDCQDKGYGLIIANGEADNIQYKYQFGQNMTTVMFERSSSGRS